MKLVSLIAQRWMIIVACIVLGVGGAVGYSLMQPRMYSATVRLYVVSGTADLLEAYQGTQAAQTSVRSFATLASDPSVVSRAIDAAGVATSTAAVIADMTVSVPPQTVVMDITIRTENATDAPKLALAVAQDLTGLVDKLEAPQAGGPGALRLQIVDPSTQGAVRDPLVDPVAGGAGAVLGAIVGVLAALALQRRRRSAAESRGAEDTEDRPAAGEATASSTSDGTADTEQFPVVTPPTTASTARHHRRDGT